MAKVQISIDDELLARLDKESDAVFMSRSGYISFCVAQKIKEQAVVTALTDLAKTMRRISENSEIDEEAKKDLADFELLVKMFNSK